MSKLAEHAEKLKRHVEEMREAASRDLIIGPRPAPSTIELLLAAVIDLLDAAEPSNVASDDKHAELGAESSRVRVRDGGGVEISRRGGPYKPYVPGPGPTVWDVGRHIARACASMNSRDAALGLILKSPCLWCGYNGEGYWSLRTHAESCPWHEIGGQTERLLVLGAYTPREREEDT